MSTLTTNAYSELRKAGYYSGTDTQDDVVISLVIGFCKTLDDHSDSADPDTKVAAIEILRDLAFGNPIRIRK